MQSASDRGNVSTRLAQWLDSGRPVCVLQGFSGVGKTSLVREFAGSPKHRVVQINAVAGTSHDDLLLEIASELDSIGLPAMGDQPDQDLRKGLHAVLREPCLIIIDDFQEILNKDTLLPDPSFLSLLQQVSHKPLPGRILAVTNVSLAEGPWRDDISVETLPAPGESEAIGILRRVLDAQGYPGAIAEELYSDVVRWLGYNPRAIEILSVCLGVDSIQDLIDLEPDTWNARHQAVSPRLIRQLETRFLDRTVGRLDSNSRLLLDFLSIYRIPFTKDVFERIAPRLADVDIARDTLAARFLLSFYRGWYDVNKIAKYICSSQLNNSPKILRSAHDLAADHYVRHFKARTVADPLRHGKEFVEARYHLTQSDRESEFADVAGRFRARLLATYKSSSIPIPDDAVQLNERILVLAAALSDQEAPLPALREFLARLCLRRGRSGDEIVALNQLRIATKKAAPSSTWILYLRVLEKTEGLGAIPAAVRAAADYGPPPGEDLSHVYVAGTRILGTARLYVEAAALAENGLDIIPRNEAWPLVQTLNYLLNQQDKYNEAAQIVDSTLEQIDPAHPQYNRIVESALFPAFAVRDIARLSTLASKIESAANGANFKDLAEILTDQLESNYESAATRALKGDGSYGPVHRQQAFCYLVLGEGRLAAEAFARSPQVRNSRADAWLEYLIFMALGQSHLAATALAYCLERSPTDEELADSNLWLRIWDDIPNVMEGYPAYYYPRLPSRLTGIKTDLVRVPSRPSPISELILSLIRVPMLKTATGLEGTDASGEVEAEIRKTEPNAQGLTIINQVSPKFGAVYNNRTESNMNEIYNVNQAGAVGHEARAENPVFHQVINPNPLADLAQELQALVSELRATAVTDEEQAATAAIAAAAEAANEGDESRMRGHLGSAGRWALGAATMIGAGLAVAAIKQALGG
jgi:hypothetical protein